MAFLLNSQAQGASGKNEQSSQTPWRGAQCSCISCIGLRPALDWIIIEKCFVNSWLWRRVSDCHVTACLSQGRTLRCHSVGWRIHGDDPRHQLPHQRQRVHSPRPQDRWVLPVAVYAGLLRFLSTTCDLKHAHSSSFAGKGDIVPVGPTSFEFMVPEGSPITITPCVGTVNAGEVRSWLLFLSSARLYENSFGWHPSLLDTIGDH